MSNEASKVRVRISHLLKGKVLDIGCGQDKICETADGYDTAQGDAQNCDNLLRDSYDTIFSSHCLEHLDNPVGAVHRWWDLLKTFGFMIIYVPDEDLYEQGVWPSTMNSDHRRSFTPSKSRSWSEKSVNLLDIVKNLPNHKLYSLRVVDTNYDYTKERQDQTGQGAEAHVELILQKMPFEPKIIHPPISTKIIYE